MCGRFTHMFTWAELHRLLRLTCAAGDEPTLPFSYNVAPTHTAPVVTFTPAGNQLITAKWGLVPEWWTQPKPPAHTINARSETAAAANTFKHAFQKRRCIIPASGFYEWTKIGATRQPIYITRADGAPMLLAGLWEPPPKTLIGTPDLPPPLFEPAEPSAGPPAATRTRTDQLPTFAIITTVASPDIAPIHDRMPVILEPEEVAAWLSPLTTIEQLAGLLNPAPAGILTRKPVGFRVNSPAHNTPDLILEQPP